MAGLILFCTLAMGTVLWSGQWFYPDEVIMWFAATSGPMAVWREVIVVGLLAYALSREYFDNVYLRLIWGMAATMLLWNGTFYFLDHTNYLFDAMFMINAGICFAIAALQKAPEPLGVPKPFKALVHGTMLAYYARLRPGRHLAHLNYLNDMKDNSHRLTMA